MASQEFTYNIAYTVRANEGAKPEEFLTHAELWQGIKRGARHPGDFGSFVNSCKVVSGGRYEFVREMVIGDGAVHTKDGTTILQDVLVQEGLYVAATTRDTGAKSTLIVAYGSKTEEAKEEDDPYLTLFYELKMGNKSPAPGSKEAEAIVTNYRSLAKNMCSDSVSKVRAWKLEGKLTQWEEDDKNGTW